MRFAKVFLNLNWTQLDVDVSGLAMTRLDIILRDICIFLIRFWCTHLSIGKQWFGGSEPR